METGGMNSGNSLNQFGTIVYTRVDNYRIERNMLTTLVCRVWSGRTFTVLVLLHISGRTGEKRGMHSKKQIEPGNTS